MARTRRLFTPKQKSEVVERHLKDRVPVSQLAAELDVQPTQIHNWIALFFESAESTFEKSSKKPVRSEGAQRQRELQKQKRLELKLVDKNEVIAELLEENIKLKKTNGDL